MRIFFKITFFFCIFLLSSCNKELTQDLSINADETFWFENNNAQMPVRVRGNTDSKTLILMLHGGPGASASLYIPNFSRLEEEFAVVYWDQRNSGNSQGTHNAEHVTINSFVEDVHKLLSVLKVRYGNDVSIFLMGHSWGGLLGSAYLISDFTIPANLKGWIEVSGVHNWPLGDYASRKMLVDEANNQMALGNKVDEWQKIIDLVQNVDTTSLKDMASVNAAAWKATEELIGIPNAPPASVSDFIIPVFNIPFVNPIKNESFIREISKFEASSKLYKVKLPCLLIWGKYDFVVPPALQEDAYIHLTNALYKKKVLWDNVGHSPMLNRPDEFNLEVSAFVNQFK